VVTNDCELHMVLSGCGMSQERVKASRVTVKGEWQALAGRISRPPYIWHRRSAVVLGGAPLETKSSKTRGHHHAT
jgi:hypothetical protein